MDIVDSQVHLWRGGLPPVESHRQVVSFDAAAALADMDDAGVRAAMINPPNWGDDDLALAFEAVRAHPHRFAIVRTVPLSEPPHPPFDCFRRDQRGVLGLRFVFLREPALTWISDGTLDWVWSAVEEAGLPIAMLAPDSLRDLDRIAERHPGLRLTVDHLGGRGGDTNATDEAAMRHMPDLIALARHPNVAVKASGLPRYSSGPYPFRSMHPYLKRTYEAFGPDRVFWGTDISKMQCSWRECVTMFTEELPWLAGDDLAQVMGGAVRVWWGWEPPHEATASSAMW